MKKVLLLVSVFSFSYLFSYSQNPGEWEWIHGDNYANGAVVYGTQGMANATNNPPSLYEAGEATDSSGNFWLYGGVTGTYQNLNDLWKYDPVAGEWTWMTGTQASNDPGVYGAQGVPSPANRPPSRSYGFAAWGDLAGNFWFFGGYNSGYNNDLWKYNPLTNEWTWMKGPNISGQVGVYGTQGVADTANYPASRNEIAAAWTDNSGDLWLLGGYAAGGLMNDLWRYHIATNTWTWMKGSSTAGAVGVYGTKGVENVANTPGSRMAYCHWKDNNGNLWLFGGGDYMTSLALNDLWRYNPVSNNWAWMSGDMATNVAGIYGTKCITDSTNMPGGRFENRAVWTDVNGNLWMFGGSIGGGTLPDIYNELWMYCVATNRWIWQSGDTAANPLGNWGTINVSAPTNKPNARAGANGWKDRQGHFYLFGGSAANWPTPYNDLWKYAIDSSCTACSQTLPQANFNCSDTAFCNESGKCINFFDHSTGNPTSWQWSFPGGSPTSSTLQNPDSICYFTPGTYPVTLIMGNGTTHDTLTVSPLIIFGTAPLPPTVTVRGGDTLVSSYGHSYQWYFNGAPITGANDSFYVEHQGGTYSVQITDSTGGCNSISNGFAVGVEDISSGVIFSVYPNPFDNTLTVSITPRPLKGGTAANSPLGAGDEFILFDITSRELLRRSFINTAIINTEPLARGIYLFEMRDKNGGRIMGKVVKE